MVDVTESTRPSLSCLHQRATAALAAEPARIHAPDGLGAANDDAFVQHQRVNFAFSLVPESDVLAGHADIDLTEDDDLDRFFDVEQTQASDALNDLVEGSLHLCCYTRILVRLP